MSRPNLECASRSALQLGKKTLAIRSNMRAEERRKTGQEQKKMASNKKVEEKNHSTNTQEKKNGNSISRSSTTSRMQSTTKKGKERNNTIDLMLWKWIKKEYIGLVLSRELLKIKVIGVVED